MNSYALLMGSYIRTIVMGNVIKFPEKPKAVIPYELAIAHLSIQSKEMHSACQINTYTPFLLQCKSQYLRYRITEVVHLQVNE